MNNYNEMGIISVRSKKNTIRDNISRIWTTRKYRVEWIKQDISRFLYKTMHGINCKDYNGGSVLPRHGENKFIKCFRSHDILRIQDKKKQEEIRIMLDKDSLGIFIELVKNEHCGLRKSISFDELKNILDGNKESK